MLVNRKAGREFKPTDYPGIERALFDCVLFVSSQKATPLVEKS